SAQIVQQVKAALTKLKVSGATAARLVDNRMYTPADLLIISSALTRLRAANTQLFVSRAAQAKERDVAFFQRTRAAMLAARSAELGGLTEFVSAAGFPLNRTRDGKIVALFPLDDVIWTDVFARALGAVTDALVQMGVQQSPTIAVAASVTPTAEDEIKKL